MAYPDSLQDVPPRVNAARETDGPGAVEAATSRLLAALDALEAAVERRREHDRSDDQLAAQVQALGTDRSKLAADLDAQTARTRRLEATNREIARRLDIAMATIRSVLDAHNA
jgi:septal ring factor EnvC (AmiA/AmiB activator)